MKHRTHLPQKQRKIISRIHLLISEGEMIRASMLDMETKCGKEGCRCAKGQKHRSTIIEQSSKGKTRMRTVPQAHQKQIEKWIKNWRELQDLLEQLSQIQWQKLEQLKRK